MPDENWIIDQSNVVRHCCSNTLNSYLHGVTYDHGTGLKCQQCGEEVPNHIKTLAFVVDAQVIWLGVLTHIKAAHKQCELLKDVFKDRVEEESKTEF